LIMRQAKGRAVHGKVKAWQDNTILASELQMQGNGEQVTGAAGGHALYNTGAEARKTPMQTTGDTLVALGRSPHRPRRQGDDIDEARR
jgi:hypothetical protein